LLLLLCLKQIQAITQSSHNSTSCSSHSCYQLLATAVTSCCWCAYLRPQSPSSTHTPSRCAGHNPHTRSAAMFGCRLSTLLSYCSTS
jgi:hypothetical protein